ncbi:MAG: hypothetical protein IJ349_05445 [Clostridia bacterium]|nr:hypothetical protein [Clostridia bacterium]
MLLMKTSESEEEIRKEIEQYYDQSTARGMMLAVKRNGMSAWGALMVRKSGDTLLLMRVPGIQLPERKDQEKC